MKNNLITEISRIKDLMIEQDENEAILKIARADTKFWRDNGFKVVWKGIDTFRSQSPIGYEPITEPNIAAARAQGFDIKTVNGRNYKSKVTTGTTTPTTGTTTPTTGTTTPTTGTTTPTTGTTTPTTGTTTPTTGTTVQTDFPLDPKAFTTLGDPYQYKVVDGQWFTKSWKNRGPGRIIRDWKPLKNNLKATKILDSRHPDARPRVNTSANTQSTPTVPNQTTVSVEELEPSNIASTTEPF
jgi:hypothetical protein